MAFACGDCSVSRNVKWDRVSGERLASRPYCAVHPPGVARDRLLDQPFDEEVELRPIGAGREAVGVALEHRGEGEHHDRPFGRGRRHGVPDLQLVPHVAVVLEPDPGVQEVVGQLLDQERDVGPLEGRADHVRLDDQALPRPARDPGGDLALGDARAHPDLGELAVADVDDVVPLVDRMAQAVADQRGHRVERLVGLGRRVEVLLVVAELLVVLAPGDERHGRVVRLAHVAGVERRCRAEAAQFLELGDDLAPGDEHEASRPGLPEEARGRLRVAAGVFCDGWGCRRRGCGNGEAEHKEAEDDRLREVDRRTVFARASTLSPRWQGGEKERASCSEERDSLPWAELLRMPILSIMRDRSLMPIVLPRMSSSERLTTVIPIVRPCPLFCLVVLTFTGINMAAAGPPERSQPTLDRGAIVRGPRDQKRLALVFTADLYAEGATTILDALRDRKILPRSS